jgi:hypothetical protein
MERPSLDRCRQVLREQGVELPDEELRALREETRGLARFIVELYQEEQGRRGEEGDA